MDLGFLSLGVADHLVLLDGTARRLASGKPVLTPHDAPPIVARLLIEQHIWCKLAEDLVACSGTSPDGLKRLMQPETGSAYTTITSPMYPRVQISDPRLVILGVLSPRLTIDSWCRVLLQIEEVRSQKFRRDVVQQIIELCLLIFAYVFS